MEADWERKAERQKGRKKTRKKTRKAVGESVENSILEVREHKSIKRKGLRKMSSLNCVFN